MGNVLIDRKILSRKFSLIKNSFEYRKYITDKLIVKKRNYYLIRMKFRANSRTDPKMREILHDDYAQQGGARK